jgi:hypothetical protein
LGVVATPTTELVNEIPTVVVVAGSATVRQHRASPGPPRAIRRAATGGVS